MVDYLFLLNSNEIGKAKKDTCICLLDVQKKNKPKRFMAQYNNSLPYTIYWKTKLRIDPNVS